jgi:hypothetical protein
VLITSWVVQARGPANVKSFLLAFSLRRATNVRRATSYNCTENTHQQRATLERDWHKDIHSLSSQWKGRKKITWVSMYAIRVGASVPQTDFSSSIGTAYCPIRPCNQNGNRNSFLETTGKHRRICMIWTFNCMAQYLNMLLIRSIRNYEQYTVNLARKCSDSCSLTSASAHHYEKGNPWPKDNPSKISKSTCMKPHNRMMV